MAQTTFSLSVSLFLCLTTAVASAAEPAASQPGQADQPATTQPAASQPMFQMRVGERRTIIFIVDSSGSMVTNFDFVRAELKHCIRELAPAYDFTVIFFADGIKELKIGVKSGLFPATPLNVKVACNWIDKFLAGNRIVRHDADCAIERAFKLIGRGRGTIWFISDGMLAPPPDAKGPQPEMPDKTFARLNTRNQVAANTLIFIDRTEQGEKLMKKIAAENGGTYRFVSEDELYK